MATNKLVPYWVKLREKGDPDNFWNLTDLTNEHPAFGSDRFIDLFSGICEGYQGTPYIDYSSKKTFSIERIQNDFSTAEGVINSGDFGYTADLYNVEEDIRRPGAIDTSDAEEIPYYFFLHTIASDPKRAILILRKFRRKGVKSLLKDRLNEELQQIDESIFLSIKPVVTQDITKKIEEADRIIKLTLEGKEPKRAVDQLGANNAVTGVEDDSWRKTITLKPPRRDSFVPSLITEVFSNEDFEYGEIKGDNFDDAKVTIKEAGSDITFSLWETKLHMKMEIDTEDVTMVGGHPKASSLTGKAQELVNHVLPDNSGEEIDKNSLL